MMRSNSSLKKALCVAIAVASAVVCPLALSAGQSAQVFDLKNLQQLTYGATKGESTFILPDPEKGGDEAIAERNLRLKAMREAALSLGAQHGYVNRLEQHKAFFEENDQLFANFDFDTIMRLASNGGTEMFLLPPVIQRLDNVSAVSESATRVRISGLVHVIKRPARLVLNPPDWHQYLVWDDPVEVDMPSRALLPKTDEEQILWHNWVSVGWLSGIQVADDEMRFRIRRLGEDFNGMVRYMALAFQGKVKRPYIAEQHTDVVGGGSEMREDESVYEISIPASLHPNSKEWDPIFGDDRESLRFPSESAGYITPLGAADLSGEMSNDH